MSSDTPNGIVPATGDVPGSLAVNAPPMALVLDRLRVMWCNVALQSPEAKALLHSIVATPTVLDTERFGRTFGLVAAIVQHPSEHVGEGGEVFSAPIVTLLTDEGETFRWASSGVADCLAVLTMDRPPGVWHPPVYVKCIGIRTKKGFQRMTLQAAPAPAPAKPTKGGKDA